MASSSRTDRMTVEMLRATDACRDAIEREGDDYDELMIRFDFDEDDVITVQLFWVLPDGDLIPLLDQFGGSQ